MAGENPMNRRLAVWLFPLILLGAAHAQFRQQGAKLVGINGSGSVDQFSQGASLALSADGNTALIGATNAEWVFTRNNCAWTQQAELAAAPGNALTTSVALSADGNTALVGGQGRGAASVFVRTGSLWSQQGQPLVAAVGQGGGGMALSADGNTAALGLPAATGTTPQIVVFIRNQGVWSQQGPALAPIDYVQTPFARQPINTGVYNSLALSADGSTLLFGVPDDNSWTGATWVFIRANSQWTQQAKLVGAGAVGAAEQGNSVALSSDGNTALIGGPSDNEIAGDGGTGGAWVFTRSAGTWSQQGNKLVGRDATPGSATLDGVSASVGWSVSLSGDGNTAIISGPDDDNYSGAAWIFTRSVSATWSQQSHKLIGKGAGLLGDISQGLAVAISADGNTALIGSNDYGPSGQIDVGSTFVFAHGAAVFASAGNPQNTFTGALFPSPLEITAVDANGAYLAGANIALSGPSSGSGAQLVTSPTATDSTGRVAATSQANGTAGSYSFQASSVLPGACSTPAATAFSLSNVNPNAAGDCVVTTGADDNGPGTLRYQVAACGKGGTVTFDPSVSLITLSQGQDIQFLQDLTIDGGANGVTIDGQNQSRIFFVSGGNITLKSLTLRNGSANGGNGGDGVTGGGGAAGMGGAVFVNGGGLNVGNVTFFGNDAFGGRGGFGTGLVPGGGGGGGGIGGDGGIGGQFGAKLQNGNGGGGGDFGSSGGTVRDGSGGSENASDPSGGFGGGAAPPPPTSGVLGTGGFGGGGAGLTAPGVFGGAGSGNDGGGGAGLGGAIFVRSGKLLLAGASFSSNSANGGASGAGQPDGQGKGGALFINSTAAAVQIASTLRSDSASDSGARTLCNAVLAPTAADTNEVCGALVNIAAVTGNGGGGQSTAVLSPFSMPLTATVTDGGGNPISGVPVTFAGPPSGASISPNNVSAITDIYGNATVNVSANAANGTYTVTTNILGVPTAAQYSLTNRLPVADLAVTKIGPTAATGGDNITYTLTVTNGGPDAAQNVTLSDTIPTNMAFQSITQNSGPVFACTAPSPGGTGALNCTATSLPAGLAASFSLVVRVYAIVTGPITNTASVSATSTDTVLTNNTASFTTTIAALPPAVLAMAPIYTLGASYRITGPSTGLALGPIYAMGASYRIGVPSTPLGLGPIFTQGASYRIGTSATGLALGPIYTPGASYRIGASATGLALGPIYTRGASYRIGAPSTGLALGPIYTPGASYRVGAPLNGPALGPIYTQGASYRIGASATGLALGPIYTQGASYRITTAVLLSPAQVSTTASGLAYSRVSQTYNGTITVRNIGSSPIAGPIQIVFTALPNGVTVANATAKFNGAPYLTIPNVTSLPAGQSATVNVAFQNLSNLTITFAPVIYSGSF